MTAAADILRDHAASPPTLESVRAKLEASPNPTSSEAMDLAFDAIYVEARTSNPPAWLLKLGKIAWRRSQCDVVAEARALLD